MIGGKPVMAIPHGKWTRHLVLLLGVQLLLLLAGCSSTLAQLQQGYQTQQIYARGLEQYRAKAYREAIPLFRQALTLQPDFDDAEAYLAWSYYFTGEYIQATKHFRLVLARQPKWEGLYDGLGWSRYQVKRYYLALDAFRQALALDPQYRDAEVGFAYTLFELGRYAEALPQLERLTREGEGTAFRRPTDDLEQVRSRYAWSLFYLGDYARARDQFTRGLAVRPNWYGLSNGLGWTYLRLGDRARAQEQFRRALRLKPDLVDARDGLAMARP
jgi:protein O-GlcNAc transferase